MMDKRKYRLNNASSQIAVNEDTFDKINIESNSRLLPVGETNKIINLGEQFNKERQDSKYYRITGAFNTLFNNVLFNMNGKNSWSSFNQSSFKDGSLSNDEDLTYEESITKHLKENNGWFGYLDPTPAKSSLCSWVDMEPNRNLFSLAPKNGVKNWEITISYPSYIDTITKSPGNSNHEIVRGGLILINVVVSVIGNRNMLTFTTPVKHNLNQGDAVEINGLEILGDSGSISPYNGQYSVIRLGKDNGDDKDYYFSVDIGELVGVSTKSRMAKVVNGKKSLYYVRVFKKVTVKGGKEIGDDDYEVHPLAFSQTIYEDKECQFVFNEDIDITNLVDNLGRPLSELYLTIIKTDSDNTFTPVKSGVKMPLSTNISKRALSNINKITNDSLNSDIEIESNVIIDNDLFYGDVVEYNLLEFKETVLGDVYHTFNTIDRESDGGSVAGKALGIRHEGYMYKPHHKIEIRKYSNYVEEGLFNTLDRPKYSKYVGTKEGGRYLWRDLLDIGLNDTQETYLDYPFLNGSHYINKCINLPLFRQDPFGFYGLKWNSYPADASGTPMEDNTIIKNSQDVC
jgi:hypothetical protein